MKPYLLTTILAGAAGATALGGCTTTGHLENHFCNADPAKGFVGQKADAGSGLAIRQATGADEVRWAPPRSALTMDFREGRVTVAYDDDMVITQVTCG